MTQPTALRWINLEGPMLLARQPDDSLIRRPLWSLRVATPYRTFEHLVDYVHSMRTLMIDGQTTNVFVKPDHITFASRASSPQPLRAPRLFDIHLIAGAKEAPWAQNGANEAATINFLATRNHWSATVRNPSQVSPLFRTLAETPDFPNDGFVHVVAEPQSNPQPGQKGDFLDQAGTGVGQDEIRVPPLRLVQGAVRLKVKVKKFPWLGALEPPATGGEFDLVFTADGIEVITSVPFPGCADPIKGCFLIAPRPIEDKPDNTETALILKLLPDHPETLAAPWRDAWQNAIADKSAADAAPYGVAMRARPSGPPPAFCWTLKRREDADPDNPVLADVGLIVDVPPTDLRIELLGSKAANGTPNGIAELQLTRLQLALPAEAKLAAQALLAKGHLDDATLPGGGDVVVIAEAIPPERAKSLSTDKKAAPANDFWLISNMATNVSSVALKPVTPGTIRVTHDEHRLAATLRGAYGWEDPHAINSNETGGPFTQSDRPLVSGFVPVTRGWLQLPFPNLPPVDISKDASLIAAIDTEPSSAIDGFVRFGTLSEQSVISGYPDNAAGAGASSAPWSATIDGVRSAVVLIAVKQPARGGGKGTIVAARAALRNPRLSTRGLFWLSSNGPDALEALPRLGAGPGSFFDIPLTTSPVPNPSTRVVTIGLNTLEFSFDGDGGKLGQAEFSLSFNSDAKLWITSQAGTKAGKHALGAGRSLVLLDPKVKPCEMSPWPPVQWLRHPWLPLIANMPMTRSAASAVPPLESREFAPFARPLGKDPIVDLGTIGWSSGEAFARVDPAPFRKLVSAWPTQPKSDKLPDRGIAFTEFGVPGVELTPPLDRADTEPWGSIWFALRYDLPALDEAFATVGLPQVYADKPLPPDELASITAAPVVTALDWPVITEFWNDQERRRQLSLVTDSYLGPYRTVEDTPFDLKIQNLLRGAVWSVKTTFDSTGGGAIPYGALRLDDATLIGNDALLGLSGQLTLDENNTLTFTRGGDPDQAFGDKLIGLLGWSLSTFDKDGWRIDNQGVGTTNPVFTPDKNIITRQLRTGLNGDARTLATAIEDITVLGGFSFWFKDVPLAKDGSFGEAYDGSAPPDTSIRFDSWFDPTEGLEWRFYRNDTQLFRGGRYRIPFDGIALEPLRLLYMALDLNKDIPTSKIPSRVDILARVSLGDEDRRPELGGNLVVLGLKPHGNGLTITDITTLDKSLRFALSAREEGKTAERRITVTAKPKIAQENDTPTLKFDVNSLGLPLCGQQVELSNNIEWSSNAGKVEITFTNQNNDPVPPGKGRLSLQKLVVTTILDSTGAFGISTVRLDLAIAITPYGCMSPSVVAAGTTFTILGESFRLNNFIESDGAVTLIANDGEVPDLTLAKLFKLSTGKACFLLVAAAVAGADKDKGFLDLDSGRFEGEIRSTAPRATVDRWVACRLIRFEIEAGRRPRPENDDRGWTGFLSITGDFTSDSSISWPCLVLVNQTSSGRCKITRDSTGPARQHNLTLFFVDHRVDLSQFGIEGNAWTLNRTWAAFVTATHKLSSDGKTDLTWTSVESIAFGPVKEIIPAIPSEDQEEPVTFAPRYRSPDADPAHLQTEMIQVGLGRLRTVLEGTLGGTFRSQLPAAARSGTVVAGGFLGSIDTGDKEKWLLRLPFLVGIPDSVIGDTLRPNALSQSEIPDFGIELAWADVSPKLTLRPHSAKAPAHRSEHDLAVAVSSGSLVDGDGESLAGEITPAMLVEQSFGIGFHGGQLTTSPFWLASAAIISRCLRYPSDIMRQSLSIVAGSVSQEIDDKEFRRGVASVVWSMPEDKGCIADKNATPAPPTPILISGGGALRPGRTDFMSELWNGGDPAKDPTAANGYAGGFVLARYARPLFAAVRTVAENSVKTIHYSAVTLPRSILADMPKPAIQSGVQSRFADNARGYATAPGKTAETMAWLPPVLEGRVAAVRDDEPNGSGIAGLGRSLALPAQAATPVETTKLEELARSLIWLSEKRIPVYLPLEINDLQAPPFEWLQTVPRCARLPADNDVAIVLKKAGIDQTAESGELRARARQAQAFIPNEMAALTVGERAGILTARRTFLLGAVPVESPTSFDESHGRFGRPAQAGTSMRQWMRTPRPAPLPPNTGAPERDRRPEASPLLPKVPLRFLVGPADTIRGEAIIPPAPVINPTAINLTAPWSATFIAAPLSDGVVTERWDGSLRLRVELDVDIGNILSKNLKKDDLEAAIMPLAFFVKVLLPTISKNDKSARASATLKIGNRVFQFRSLACAIPTKEAENPWQDVENHPNIIRGVVDLVLDLTEPASQARREAGGINADLSEGLLSSSQSSADLRLTVHPDDWHKYVIFDDNKAPVALSIQTPAATALVAGAARPPVTLRWTLPAVMTDRGGLPLVPTTMLFVDPAYEAGLANPPHDSSMTPIANIANSPANRGQVHAVFSADRGRVNRVGTVAFMLDVRFEVPPSPFAPNPPNDVDGDLCKPADTALGLQLQLLPSARTEPNRYLQIASIPNPKITLASVYELSLAMLTEMDGSPARLSAGDILMLRAISDDKLTFNLWNRDDQTPINNIPMPKGNFELDLLLTDEPVVEPPPALYAAAVLGKKPTLSLPLYAQSPLPWRVDFRNLKQDFRKGLVRRSATFVWGFARPAGELSSGDTRAHIVKSDRNGQTYLPIDETEFLAPERPRPKRGRTDPLHKAY